MARTLSFKQFLIKETGYKSKNDLIFKLAKKEIPPYLFQLTIDKIEDDYLAYCNRVHKKYKVLWD